MPDLLDAVGELIRQQTLRVHYLTDLLVDPQLGRSREVRHQLTTARRQQEARAYTVHAPCLLAQLHTAVYASTSGRGGRTVPASRMPITAAALDLWVEISVDTNGWASALGVNRRPYRDAEPDARGVPAIGQLLRATAAAAIAQHTDELADRIAYRAHGWATTISTMLAGPTADDHIYPIRGATCDTCGATSTVEDRDGERIRVPAVQIRFLPRDPDQPDPEDRWAYRICIACGDNGWITYTTTTGEAA